MKKQMYLTPSSKKYYQEQFDIAKNLNDEWWKIEPVLLDRLNRNIENEKIQTLFSSYGPKGEIKDTSYIIFSFDMNLEETIKKNLLKEVSKKFNCLIAEITPPQKYIPKDSANATQEQKKLGCITTSDYFNIFHVSIFMKSKNKKHHNYFWDFITENLIKIM